MSTERLVLELSIFLIILCFQECILKADTGSAYCFKTYLIRGKNNTTKRGKKFDCCDGYIQDDTFPNSSSIICKSVCMPACINGTCVSPGQCECTEGYEKDATDANICRPPCTTACPLDSCESDACKSQDLNFTTDSKNIPTNRAHGEDGSNLHQIIWFISLILFQVL